MPVTYSLDLRKRIVEKYYEGYTIKEVSEIYNVSSSAVGRYLQLDDNNVLEPKKRGTKKPPRIDIADFAPKSNGTKYAGYYLEKGAKNGRKCMV
ncbi:MAG: IS630 transposase-related protein [Deinococcaceae bacterium]